MIGMKPSRGIGFGEMVSCPWPSSRQDPDRQSTAFTAANTARPVDQGHRQLYAEQFNGSGNGTWPSAPLPAARVIPALPEPAHHSRQCNHPPNGSSLRNTIETTGRGKRALPPNPRSVMPWLVGFSRTCVRSRIVEDPHIGARHFSPFAKNRSNSVAFVKHHRQ